MREHVRALVRGELGGATASDVFREASARAFLQVFQRLSASPGRPRGSAEAAAAEAGVSDEIAAHLLRCRAQGAEPQLRFHGLRRRLQAVRGAALRASALELLFALRDGGASASSGPSAAKPGSRMLDALPPSAAAADAKLQLQQALAEKLLAQKGAAPVAERLPGRAPAPVAARALGWHIAGGPPSGMDEGQLLRDLLHALQGVDSACFRYDEVAERFCIDASYVLSRPAWSLVQRILEIGNLHMQLSAAIAVALEAEAVGRSLLQQALCEALREQLRDYYAMLALLMAKATEAAEGQEMTLRRLWTWLQAPLERMRLLVALAGSCRPLRGGALASAVYGCSRVGDTLAQEACASVLRRVLAPLLAMMRAWMTEGELRDPFQEFFVCADASVPLEDLWDRRYALDVEMVPSFISLDLARRILLTGKSVNFIRLCCPGQEWLPEGEGRPGAAVPALATPSRRSTEVGVAGAAGQRLLAHPGDARAEEDIPGAARAGEALAGWPVADLSACVEEAALRTNKHLVALMMGRYAVGEHCLALRKFLLLGQGDFIESLLDAAGPELSKSAGDVYRHTLQGLVEMAVRQTNAQFCPPDVLARLGVKLLKPSTGEKAWDTFLLDYAIDSPLHVVFTPVAMQQYERAFAFLWKLRRVSHALAACWSQQMALRRHLVACGHRIGPRAPELRMEMRQTLHKCTCLRNEMHHFVQNIHSYIMCEVLETSWAKLQVGWRACVDLDQVILEHQRYLSCIEEGAFLARCTEPILTALGALFGLALEFTELHDQVCSSAFETIDILSSEPDGPMPFARSLAECRAQLDRLGASFLARLLFLLRALEAQPALRHLTSDLRFLLCRLDFNAYYEQRRAPPPLTSDRRSAVHAA